MGDAIAGGYRHRLGQLDAGPYESRQNLGAREDAKIKNLTFLLLSDML